MALLGPAPAAALAVAWHLGTASVGLATIVLFVFLYVLRTSVQAEERGEELAKRTQELASLLHDIGKFILPDSVLFAKRKLTDDEWKLIKLHPEQGAKLVGRIEGYGPVAEIVLHHHERFGGGGYPAGIAASPAPSSTRRSWRSSSA